VFSTSISVKRVRDATSIDCDVRASVLCDVAFSPDSRWYYQGNPEGDSISVIDMQSLTKIKTIPGFVEPLNVTFTADGSKAYIGNYGAHWVGVIDVRRHELSKKIQIAEFPGIAKLDPDKHLGEVHGINIAMMGADGRYLYAADGDLGVVGVIALLTLLVIAPWLRIEVLVHTARRRKASREDRLIYS